MDEHRNITLPMIRQRGFSLMEVLVTIVIMAIGLMGLAGLQVKVQSAETESYQRSQAILLVQDMANRISANRKNAASYVSANALGTADSQPPSCATLTGVALDQCEWSLALKGSSELQASTSAAIGAMIGARGCVELMAGTEPPVYRVTVAWQGLSPLGTPSTTCGMNQYGTETLRRAISSYVSVADLSKI